MHGKKKVAPTTIDGWKVMSMPNMMAQDIISDAMRNHFHVWGVQLWGIFFCSHIPYFCIEIGSHINRTKFDVGKPHLTTAKHNKPKSCCTLWKVACWNEAQPKLNLNLPKTRNEESRVPRLATELSFFLAPEQEFSAESYPVHSCFDCIWWEVSIN